MKPRARINAFLVKARMFAFFVGMLAALSAPPGAAVDVSQSPLYLGTTVPGNLALVPSVEFPTLISVANFGDYDVDKTYTGYFDADKCYDYVYDASEPKRHFEPRSAANGHKCSGRWSGNYMNWATTQTIDPFRSALTGGYRVVDTVTDTWVEKAISDRDGGESTTANFPRRTIPSSGNDSNLVKGATPATWNNFRTRIDGLGNKMRFTSGSNASSLGNNNPGTDQPVPYNPATTPLDNGKFATPPAPSSLTGKNRDSVVYEVSVRVAVCVVGQLEPNCKQYGANWKPEGLLQQYSERLLYSIFGYINNGGGTEPEGGVMRARQKFIGPNTYYPTEDVTANTSREWDPLTGVLVRNPNPADATATGGGVADSGVINYLNRFGQMNTGRVAKSYDNVSELYYTATRYFKNLGNVPSYSALAADATNRYRDADGFPVITNWDDPIRYQCQANVILGIGDTNTWRDKDVPGATSTDEEPTKAPEVVADDTVDSVKAMKQIFRMEGFSDTDADTMSKRNYYNGSGRKNSAYIAALAYDAHTRDIRPDNNTNGLPDKQTISTYWVDVVENRDYKKGSNQYWLAAKYGGFTVPEGYNPYPATPVALTDSSWWKSAEYVNNDTTYKRPDNFYTAAEAGKMVESLRKAFENILEELPGSGASFAANTTSLQAGAQSFQARFYSVSWRGELSAYAIDPITGALSSTPLWNAADKFPTDWTTRNLYTYNGSNYKKLTWNNLSTSGQLVLGAEQVLDYLRGDRTYETTIFRPRKGVLGDIVDSEPVYVGAPNPDLYQGQTFTGASDYQAFVSAQAARTPVVYVGANDGMLHGFNADSSSSDAGTETYGYMPNAAINSALRAYTLKGYVHQYTVDGEMTVADVYIGSGWKTVLVGTMGRGGRAVFALDVTDPSNVKFLWEKNATDIPALGNNLGKPLIGQVADGSWRVLIGNGPNSTLGKAQLISINLANGNATSIDTGVAGDNALTGVRLWDSDGDGFVDSAYGGDLKGNLWRFKNLGGTPTVARLYTATGPTSVAQPITAAPLVARNPKTGDTWVYFGTGRYLSTGDVSTRDVQSWYGLIDKGTQITGSRDTNFSRIDILAESGSARAISENSTAGTYGWYMDLVSPGDVKRGERMVVPNIFQGRALVGTTRIPDSVNPCTPSGTGYVMAIDPFTGGRLPSSFFDIDGSGTVGDAGDLINVGGQNVPSSGLLLNSGPNRPIFVGGIMQMTLDNGKSKIVKTQSGGNSVKRVTWREVVGGS